MRLVKAAKSVPHAKFHSLSTEYNRIKYSTAIESYKCSNQHKTTVTEWCCHDCFLKVLPHQKEIPVYRYIQSVSLVLQTWV